MANPPKSTSASPAVRVPRWAWLAVAAVAIIVVAVIVAIVGLWATIGTSQISLAGWAALILGIAIALGLWIGLMSLMFISNRRGYDDL